jgi:hypothetical protein
MGNGVQPREEEDGPGYELVEGDVLVCRKTLAWKRDKTDARNNQAG